MIKICHLLDQTLENRVGGVEFINDLFFKKNKSKRFSHQLLDAKYFNLLEPYPLINHFQTKFLHKKVDCEAIHIHQIQPYGLNSLIQLAQKIPCIFTLHDYYLFCQKSTYYHETKSICKSPAFFKCSLCNSNNIKGVFLPAFFYFRSKKVEIFLKFVKKIILPNQELLKLIPKKYHYKCNIIHYAVPQQNTNHQIKKSFVYLGTLANHKGIFQLIEDLQKVAFNEELHIYSPNSFTQKVPHFVKHKGLMTNKSLLSQYKALIIPSLWKETGPIVLQEALSAKTEVILYNSPISTDYSCLNGVHKISSACKLQNFIPQNFELNIYSLKESIKKHENIYLQLSKDA
ncbi:MAG: hypothetical protein COB02_02730 [Candidatus Cloacimonadota bacterium]|nr:MAG: hypothetical protein COB02_02730 [Candidatus Cloacimonadota bacterium]